MVEIPLRTSLFCLGWLCFSTVADLKVTGGGLACEEQSRGDKHGYS